MIKKRAKSVSSLRMKNVSILRLKSDSETPLMPQLPVGLDTSRLLLPDIIRPERHVQYDLPYQERETSLKLPPIEKKHIEVRVPVIVRKPKSSVARRECNYTPATESVPSLLSNLPDHWRDEQSRVARERPSESEAQQQAQKADDRTDSIEEETEGVLPRTFFPLGVDWDSRLEAANYGTDVMLRSSSSSSTLAGQNDRPSLTDFVSVADWFLHTKGAKLGVDVKQSPIADSDDDFEEDDKKSRKVVVARGPPRLIFGENGHGRDDQLIALEAARRRHRKESKQRQSLDKHFRRMNEALQSEGPMDHAGLWTTDEPVAHSIMRRATVEKFKGREVIHNLIRKSCLKRRTSFESYLEKLDFLKNELDSIDSVRKVALNSEFLNSFCHQNVGETVDLVLHGKQIFERAGRRLYDFDLPYIFLFLLDRPEIVTLDLCYNNLTCFGVRFLADFLSWDTRIKSLNLMNNDIEAMDSYVVDAFGENHTLKSLRLNGNSFGKKGGEYLSFLLMFKDLEHLDIGQTDQTIQSIAWISEALIQTSTLKVLDLSRILSHPGYNNDSLHYGLAFSDILRLNKSLVELHIPKNNITDVDLEQILFGLSFNRTLELLDLSCNSIGDYGAEMMADALDRGAPLKAIMLSNNQIGNKGARAFSFKLQMSQIKLLDLSHNRIRDEGIVDIVATVKKPYPLFALFIFGNPFGKKALQEVEYHLEKGNLDSNSLDVVLHYHNGVVGHGQNINNRYKTRYYRLMERDVLLPDNEPGCDSYQFHNAFVGRNIYMKLPSIYLGRGMCHVRQP